MKYDQWSLLAGTYGDMPAPHDATPDVLSNSVDDIICFARCSLGGPATIRELHEGIGEWVSTLYSQAAPLDGPVRIMASDISMNFPMWEYDILKWDLSFPLSDVTIPPTGAPFDPRDAGGFLIDGPEDVAKLRQARSQQLNEEFHPIWVGGFIPTAENGGALHGLYVRDVLPIENAAGVVEY